MDMPSTAANLEYEADVDSRATIATSPMSSSSKKDGKRRADAPVTKIPVDEDGEELEFEDEYGDEFEEEVFDGGEEGEEGEEGVEDMATADSELIGADGVHAETEGRLWRAGDAMAADEKLDYDSSAYDMLHRMNWDWSCLSFAFVRDSLGEHRTAYPQTAYVVAGTQAERASDNQLVCLKLSQMARTIHDDDSESDDDDEDDDDDPIVEAQRVKHKGVVNRLKLMPQTSHICATWADTGKVHVHNLAAPLGTLHSPGSVPAGGADAGPLFTFGGHAEEGYALDWSPVKPGVLATGDNTGRMHLWQPVEGGSWAVEPEAFVGHTAACEDIEWSPVEPNVMMSCGCDSTVRVWDVRRKGGSALTVDEKHGVDINVLSWNKLVNYLVVTGADDGSFRVWDLRSFSSGEPVAKFNWHKAAITSVEWSPHESSTIGVCGEDNQLTLWDLALEDDPEATCAVRGREDLADIPPQLYFVHQGQNSMKELHWHAQCPGVVGCTAEDFNIFKAANFGDGAAAE